MSEKMEMNEEANSTFIAANKMLEAAELLKPFNGLLSKSIANQAAALLDYCASAMGINLTSELGGSCGENCSCGQKPSILDEISDEVKNDIDSLIAELESELKEL